MMVPVGTMQNSFKQPNEASRDFARAVFSKDAVSVVASGGSGIGFDGVDTVAFVVVDDADVTEIKHDDIAGVQNFRRGVGQHPDAVFFGPIPPIECPG